MIAAPIGGRQHVGAAVAGALPGGLVAEPKWDGFRAALVRQDDTTTLRSRRLKGAPASALQ